jgi:hypothetical protein
MEKTAPAPVPAPALLSSASTKQRAAALWTNARSRAAESAVKCVV